MPLGVIRTLHPGAKFGRAPPVMPQVEVGKIDGLIKVRRVDQTLALQWGDQIITLRHPFIDLPGSVIRTGVQVSNEVLIMAFEAHALHVSAVILPIGTWLADRAKQVPRQAIAHIMGGAGRPKPAHMAQCASGGGEVSPR